MCFEIFSSYFPVLGSVEKKFCVGQLSGSSVCRMETVSSSAGLGSRLGLALLRHLQLPLAVRTQYNVNDSEN